jgi:predicted glycoside hydrolase/deacetylase ChbG (UPF0249 family)
MLFQAKWRNAVYIVRPTVRIIHPGYGVELKPGLRAEFTGPQRIFDSERSQEKYDWTDEERERVEKHLLKHKDYGNGLYLAPGQELPQEFEKVARKPDTARARCVHVEFVDGTIRQCDEIAMVGGNKCATHRDDRVAIGRGMVTSEGIMEGSTDE